jgi:hypothetical protein
MVSFVVEFEPIEQGHVRVKTISILEDYWHDYLHFKQIAATEKGKSELRHRRYLRVALLTLIAYAEGVVNDWWFSVLQRRGESELEINNFMRRPFHVKCNKLTEEASLTPSRKQQLIKRAKTLRNDLVHLTTGNDARLFDGLSETLMIETEAAIIGWLDDVSSALGRERHANTQEIGRDLAKTIGAMTNEEYSAS